MKVVTAKLMTLRQRNKTVDQRTKELEDVTEALEGAHISDGLTSDLACQNSTQHANEAMSQYYSNEKSNLSWMQGHLSM